MSWELVGTVLGVILGALQVVTILLGNKTRGDVAEIKLWVAEKREQDSKETRDWVEKEFVRKEVLQAMLAKPATNATR